MCANYRCVYNWAWQGCYVYMYYVLQCNGSNNKRVNVHLRAKGPCGQNLVHRVACCIVDVVSTLTGVKKREKKKKLSHHPGPNRVGG